MGQIWTKYLALVDISNKFLSAEILSTYENIFQECLIFSLMKRAKYRGLPKSRCKKNLLVLTKLQGYATFSKSECFAQILTIWDPRNFQKIHPFGLK